MGKILFIRGGAVGDFILTLPAIQLVREQLPDAEVEVLGYPPIVRLAEAAGLVDATRSIEYGPLSSFFMPKAVLDPELMDYFDSFSVVISYLYDPDGFFEDNLSRSGVDTLYRGPYRIAENEKESPTPAATQLAKPLENLALFLDQPHVTLSFDDSSRADAEAFLHSSQADSDTHWVAIHPGSGSPRKNWSFEGWIEVAKQLHAEDPQTRFLVSSGEAEDRTVKDFLALLEAEKLAYAHASHLPLPVLGSVLQRAQLFLGHDSGISHLAAACGVPAVLVFGPTDPEIWAPRNPEVITVQAPEGDLSQVEEQEILNASRKILHN